MVLFGFGINYNFKDSFPNSIPDSIETTLNKW